MLSTFSSHGDGPQHMMLVFVKNVSATVWPTNASTMTSLDTAAVLIAEKIQQDQNARLIIKIERIFIPHPIQG